VVVGGQDINGEVLDRIHKFNPITNQWDLIDQHLSVGREFATTVPIPDTFATCT